MNKLSLFSGIGGDDLASDWAGIETVCFVEQDKFCQQVLKKHWPDTPIIERIQDVNKETVAHARCQHEKEYEKQTTGLGESGQVRGYRDNPLPTIDIIAGGFPCQPFSVAGKRGGEEDDRYLWPEMLRVICEFKPRWCLIENVAGLESMVQYDSSFELEDKEYTQEEMAACLLDMGEIRERTGGGILFQILEDLETEGYEVQTYIVPACAVNAPHRRDRIFIVGYAAGNGLNITQDREGIEAQNNGGKEGQEQVCQPQGADSLRTEDVADTNTEGLQESACNRLRSIRGQEGTPQGSESSRAITEGWRQWAVEPEFCLLADGLSKKLDGGVEDGRAINAGQKSTSFCWGEVRRLWYDYLSRDSSHRWRQDEQLAEELTDILQRLSYPLALAKWEDTLAITFAYLHSMQQACEAIGAMRNTSLTVDEAWQSLSEEDKDWVIMASGKGRFVAEWLAIPRVATGIKNRVDRLKSLGNAVVPQQVYPFYKAIMEIERIRGK